MKLCATGVLLMATLAAHTAEMPKLSAYVLGKADQPAPEMLSVQDAAPLAPVLTARAAFHHRFRQHDWASERQTPGLHTNTTNVVPQEAFFVQASFAKFQPAHPLWMARCRLHPTDLKGQTKAMSTPNRQEWQGITP